MCNTTFMVLDEAGKEIGGAISNEQGVFACHCAINDNQAVTLKATRGKDRWELKFPTMGTMKGTRYDYEMKIETVEKLAKQAQSDQNELIGGAKEQDANTAGSTEESQEIIGGIGTMTQMAHKGMDAEFARLKKIANKGCGSEAEATSSSPNNNTSEFRSMADLKAEQAKMKLDRSNEKRTSIANSIAKQTEKIKKGKNRGKLEGSRLEEEKIKLQVLNLKLKSVSLDIDEYTAKVNGEDWTKVMDTQKTEQQKQIKEEIKSLEKEAKKL